MFKNLSQEEIGKEAFFPPFEAVKVRLEVGSGTRCMKIELYYFDAGMFTLVLILKITQTCLLSRNGTSMVHS